MNLLCDANPTTREEGEHFVLKVRAHQEDVDWVAVWFYTIAGTADASDYVNHDGERGSARNDDSYNDIIRWIHTLDDNYSEFEEQFDVRIGNQSNGSSQTRCTLTIQDDDGVGIHSMKILTSPANGENYRPGEKIQLEASFTGPVTVENDRVAIMTHVGDNSRVRLPYRHAVYESGSGTDKLIFSFNIGEGDYDLTGFSVPASSPGNPGFFGNIYDEDGEVVNPWYRGIDDVGDPVLGITTYELSEDNDFPWSVYAGDTHFWVLNRSLSGNSKLYAYRFNTNKSEGRREGGRDIDVSHDRQAATGMWADGETVWVSYQRAEIIRAYSLDDGSRLPDSDIPLGDIDSVTWGIWADGQIMYVVKSEPFSLEAYDMVTKEPIDSASLTFDEPSISGYGGYLGGNVVATWLDSKRVWLSHYNGQLYAHSRSEGDYESSKNITELNYSMPEYTGGRKFQLPLGPGEVITGMWVGDRYMWAVTMINESPGNLYRFGRPSKIDPYARVTDIQVASTPENETGYRIGEAIEFDVSFSHEINVIGEPTLPIMAGNELRKAGYKSGGGTDTLRFEHKVRADDGDEDGITVPPLEEKGLGSGTLRVKSGSIYISQAFRASALKNLEDHKVDDSVYVAWVRIDSEPANATNNDSGYYTSGESIEISAKYSHSLGVEGDIGLRLEIGDQVRTAVHYGPLITSTPTFRYEVAEDDYDADGIAILDGLSDDFSWPGFLFSQQLVSGSDLGLVDFEFSGAGDPLPDHKVVNPASIAGIEITSDPGEGDTYAGLDVIEATVTFHQGVFVTGQPVLNLLINDRTRSATYSGSTGTATAQDLPDISGSQAQAIDSSNESAPTETLPKTAVFTYQVLGGDQDTDGISIEENSLELNGGTIVDAGDFAADLSHDAVEDDSAHMVDSVSPSVEDAWVETDGNSITVEFSEEIGVSSLLGSISELTGVPVGHFFIAVMDIIATGTGHVVPRSARLNGTELTFELDDALVPGQIVKLSYNNIFAEDAQGIFIDRAGNPLRNFAPISVHNYSEAEGSVPETRASLILSETRFRVPEGESSSYTVRLYNQPTEDVTVSVTSSSVNLEVNTGDLTFTADNWDSPQTVRVTAAEDEDDLNYWVVLVHSATGSGQETVDDWVRVVIKDSDGDGDES